MAHTPGPWTVQNLEPGTIGHDWVDGPDRRFIAVCHEILGNGPHGYGQRVDTDEIAANARLIAASPDLLDALKRARAFAIAAINANITGIDFDPTEHALIQQVDAAITKAEGRS